MTSKCQPATVLGDIASIQLERLSEVVKDSVTHLKWQTSSETVELGAYNQKRVTITLDCDTESYPRVLQALAEVVGDES